MNNLIEELESQCIDQRWTVTGPMFDREKFAKLIIKKCLQLVTDNHENDLGNHPSDLLEEYFGVKE